MELDKRIKEGKRPLTCFDVKEAKQFIGKECYFSDHLCTFNELLDAYSYVTVDMLVSKEKHLYVGELLTVSDSDGSCYEAGINGEAEWFQFCLPCEWVEEKKEPKYRPYSLEEFIGDVNLGLEPWITMRHVGTNKECKFLYTGYQETEVGEYICLGCYQFDFISLFKNYEIYINGEWQPFGVLEDD